MTDMDVARNRAQREADRQRHRDEAEAQRERHQIEGLRLKALAEQAKGQPGVWTAEYEGRIAAIRQREVVAAEHAARTAEYARAQAAHKRSQHASNLRVLGFIAILLTLASIGTCVVVSAVGGPAQTHTVKAKAKR